MATKFKCVSKKLGGVLSVPFIVGFEPIPESPLQIYGVSPIEFPVSEEEEFKKLEIGKTYTLSLIAEEEED